jgi:hypothetical protein
MGTAVTSETRGACVRLHFDVLAKGEMLIARREQLVADKGEFFAVGGPGGDVDGALAAEEFG